MFPTTEHPNIHKAERTLACHRISYCLKISEETDNDTSAAQKENKDTESHVPRKTLDHTAALDPTEEEDRGMFYHQSEEIVDSENISQAQMSDRGHEMQDGVMCKETRHQDAPLPNEKASEMKGFLLLGTNENASLERSLNLVFTSNMDKSVHCYSEDAKSGQKEDNDLEYSVITPEIKEVEHPEISVGCCAGSPRKISICLEMGGHRVSNCQAENTQDKSQTVTEAAENPLMQCEPTKLVLGDTTADNPERTTEEGIEVMEVSLDVQRESSAGIDTSIEDKMETELQHCCDVQRRDCETDNKEVSELPGGDTEPRERGEDRNECVVPPVDSENGSTPTGECMIDDAVLHYFILFSIRGLS